MERFRYDLPLAMAAYNAGERPVASYRGIPPYPETREYVARVLRYYGAPPAWSCRKRHQQLVQRRHGRLHERRAAQRISAAVVQNR